MQRLNVFAYVFIIIWEFVIDVMQINLIVYTLDLVLLLFTIVAAAVDVDITATKIDNVGGGNCSCSYRVVIDVVAGIRPKSIASYTIHRHNNSE